MPRLSLARRLSLYADAVQQPLAEVRFADRAHAWHRRRAGLAAAPALHLREDFAGTADVAAAWALSHPNREALAVERHASTLRWAAARHAAVADLHLVQADVLNFRGPRVDVTLATNFSVLCWHERSALLRYLRHVRACLRPGGVFLMDFFGGPGAERVAEERRDAGGFGYRWVQECYEPATARIRCRIRFDVDGTTAEGFRYHWRLWRPAELLEALADAGFNRPTLWVADGRGRHRPGRRIPPTEDFVCYLSAARS